MRRSRYLIALWLSLSVPSVGVASAIQNDHCPQHKSGSAMGGEHAQHAMQQAGKLDHSSHLANHDQPCPDTTDHSNCDCGDMHCVTGGGTAYAIVAVPDSSQVNVYFSINSAVNNYPIVGHSVDLLRPPSLS